MDKCPCGRKAIGSINKQPFCERQACIDAAVTRSFPGFSLLWYTENAETEN